MLRASGSYWRDGDGVVHSLSETYYETLCGGMYRPGDVRVTGSSIVPTCLECIAAEGRRTKGDDDA